MGYLLHQSFIKHFLIRGLNNFVDLNKFWVVGLLSWILNVLIYRRSNFVYQYWGCTQIYRPLSYPFRSLLLFLSLICTCPNIHVFICPTFSTSLLFDKLYLVEAAEPIPFMVFHLAKFDGRKKVLCFSVLFTFLLFYTCTGC